VSSFQPSTSMGSSKPVSSVSQHSGSNLSSRPEASISSANPMASVSSSHSLSTSTSVFNSPTKITLQQPTPELSSLDRSPGSHQDMMADTSLGSQQYTRHTDGGDMSVSLGSHHESIGSQLESTSSRYNMNEPSTSQQDQDMDFVDEVPETSSPGTLVRLSTAVLDGYSYDYHYSMNNAERVSCPVSQVFPTCWIETWLCVRSVPRLCVWKPPNAT
jgi:hypothetical protein